MPRDTGASHRAGLVRNRGGWRLVERAVAKEKRVEFLDNLSREQTLDRWGMGSLIHSGDGSRCPLLVVETGALQDDLGLLLDWARRHGVVLERLSATQASLSEIFLTVGAGR